MFGIGLIAALIEGKVDEVAAELVSELIEEIPIVPEFLKVSRRIHDFAESGGKSELERAVDEILHGVKPEHSHAGEVVEKLQRLVEHRSPATARRQQQWMRTGWAKSRQEWLNESWRHDWRSQPRDLKGRWIPGRLSYPVNWMDTKRHHVSRRGRRLGGRRVRMNRRAARSMARGGIVSSWGRDGN